MQCKLDGGYCNHEQCKDVLEYVENEICISNCCYDCVKKNCPCKCNSSKKEIQINAMQINGRTSADAIIQEVLGNNTVQTNGDRIRRMTDEQLAGRLIEYNDGCGKYYTSDGEGFYCRETSIQHEIEWLQSEAK